MIDAIELKNFRNGEYIQFIKDACTLVIANDPALLNVVPQQTALSTKVGELEGLFKTTTANPITSDLVALDEERDQAINGLTAVVKGYTYHFEPAINNAASLLTENLKLYGSGVAVQNLQAETATITSIVGDWENKPDLAAAVGALHLNDWLTHLKTANEKFATKYIERTQEYGAASPENLKLKREETNQVYYQLRQFLDAYGVINSGNAVYAKNANELNALIAQYNTLLNNRQTSGAPETPTSPN